MSDPRTPPRGRGTGALWPDGDPLLQVLRGDGYPAMAWAWRRAARDRTVVETREGVWQLLGGTTPADAAHGADRALAVSQPAFQSWGRSRRQPPGLIVLVVELRAIALAARGCWDKAIGLLSRVRDDVDRRGKPSREESLQLCAELSEELANLHVHAGNRQAAAEELRRTAQFWEAEGRPEPEIHAWARFMEAETARYIEHGEHLEGGGGTQATCLLGSRQVRGALALLDAVDDPAARDWATARTANG